MLVSRQSEVGTKMWNSVAALIASDPTNSKKYFTSCRGRPCAVQWETDASFFFNWANPALRDWWVYTYIGGALNESAIDGVYLDCACRAPEGDRLPGSFQADAQLAVDAAIALATTLGKSIQTWNPAGGTAHGPDVDACAKAIRSDIALGNDTRFTFQPSFRGMGDPMKVTAQDYANTIGSFLLARGESALLEFPPTASPGDIYPNATQFPWSPLVDKDYGVPLGLAVETGNGTFKREWSKATIYFDCSKNDSARFVFKTDDDSSDGSTPPLVEVFPSADAGASCYRIPMLIWSSNKTDSALLAFAEARRSSHVCSDAGPKGVALRRSWDGNSHELFWDSRCSDAHRNIRANRRLHMGARALHP